MMVDVDAPTQPVLRYHGNRSFRDPGDLSKYNLSRYRVDPVTGCHVWLGALHEKGYAIVGTNRSGTFRAARLVYMRDVGPLEPGEYPDHTCRNRACINRAHLERVTNAENTRRGAKAKLNWKKLRAIRAEYAKKKTPFRKLGKKHGVSGPCISNIVNNKRWIEGT